MLDGSDDLLLHLDIALMMAEVVEFAAPTMLLRGGLGNVSVVATNQCP
jgi:hypothetical protein